MRRMSIFAAAGLAAASPLMIAPAADAGVTQCTSGAVSFTFSGVSSPWKITHAKGYENFGTTTVTWTRDATFVKKLTASASITTGGSISQNTVINKLEAHVDVTLAAAGEATKTTSESETGTLPPRHIAIFYAGNRETSGSWTRRICNSSGQWQQTNTGTVKSFQAGRSGVVDCAASPDPGTLAYVVKGQYC